MTLGRFGAAAQGKALLSALHRLGLADLVCYKDVPSAHLERRWGEDPAGGSNQLARTSKRSHDAGDSSKTNLPNVAKHYHFSRSDDVCCVASPRRTAWFS